MGLLHFEMIFQQRNKQLGAVAAEVAQNCILPYRGFVIREPLPKATTPELRRPAECNSAIQQSATLRYARAHRRENGYMENKRFMAGITKSTK